MLHQRISSHTTRTLDWYKFTLSKFRDFLTEPQREDVDLIDIRVLRSFQLDLAERVCAATVHNRMRAVKAFLRFLHSEELVQTNATARLRLPKVEFKILPAYTTEELNRLEQGTDANDPTSVRNRFLVHLLLDSGIRLAECAQLKVGDIDPSTGTFLIRGTGQKQRMCRIGTKAHRSLLRYLRIRGGQPGDPLWVGKRGAMTQSGIAEVLEKLGKRVGVHCHPHKFRRTCALLMLRNGADIFSVQHLLGHSDLDVMRRYLAQEQADIQRAHRRYSPLDNLK